MGCLPPQAAPSRTAEPVSPTPGVGEGAASWALHPDVPGSPRTGRAGSRGLAQPARTWGPLQPLSPRSASLALGGEERGGKTPRKLGEFRSLARAALASSTCW